jgi:hypothetical protein
MRHFPVDFRSSHSLPTASVCDSNIHKATRRLGPSKSVGLDGIPAFFVKGCLDVLILLLELIFNLILSQRILPAIWKQAAVVPILKERERETALLNKITDLYQFSVPFPKYLKILIHGHVSHHLNSKFNPLQHGYIKSKSPSTNLLTFLDFSILLVNSQRQVDAILSTLSILFCMHYFFVNVTKSDYLLLMLLGSTVT